MKSLLLAKIPASPRPLGRRGDYLFGNETEARAYAEAVGWDTEARGWKETLKI